MVGGARLAPFPGLRVERAEASPLQTAVNALTRHVHGLWMVVGGARLAALRGLRARQAEARLLQTAVTALTLHHRCIQ